MNDDYEQGLLEGMRRAQESMKTKPHPDTARADAAEKLLARAVFVKPMEWKRDRHGHLVSRLYPFQFRVWKSDDEEPGYEWRVTAGGEVGWGTVLTEAEGQAHCERMRARFVKDCTMPAIEAAERELASLTASAAPAGG